MSQFLRKAHRTLPPSPSSSSLIHGFKPYNHLNHHLQSRNLISSSPIQSRPYSAPKSLFESKILRILHNEIDYHADYARQPVTEFNSFTVEDRPGEQWMTMRRKFDRGEDIKIEATMFDGCMTVPRLGGEDGDYGEEDLRLHISVLVGVYKGDDGGDALEFACSAWPDRLEIQKVYFLRRGCGRPYTGPDFRALNGELQKGLGEFLKERGVNDQLSVFLHEYMMNKDKIELIQWFGKLNLLLKDKNNSSFTVKTL